MNFCKSNHTWNALGELAILKEIVVLHWISETCPVTTVILWDLRNDGLLPFISDGEWGKLSALKLPNLENNQRLLDLWLDTKKPNIKKTTTNMFQIFYSDWLQQLSHSLLVILLTPTLSPSLPNCHPRIAIFPPLFHLSPIQYHSPFTSIFFLLPTHGM